MIRYEFSGVEIGCNKNIGITIKNYDIRQTLRWTDGTLDTTEKGHFNFCVPLNMLLGFYDYQRATITITKWEIL